MKFKTKSAVAIFTATMLMISMISGMSVWVSAAYSIGSSFNIYSYPGSSSNTAGKSYLWNLTPDAKVEPSGSSAIAKFFNAGDGIVHEPTKGSLDGFNTKIIVNHRVCSNGFDSDLAAMVTYVENGVTKKSPAFRFTGFHYNARQDTSLGANGTKLDFDIGTYPNVVSVNVYHILSEEVDGSNYGIGGAYSQPYHEYVKFNVVGTAGAATIPVDQYYIETKVMPAQESGKPIATPKPTPQVPTALGPALEPLVAPAPLITDAPVVALGLGASFTLYPHNEKSVSVPEGFVVGSYGIVTTPAVGPYTIPNAADELNFKNGITRIDIAENGKIIKSDPGAYWGRYGTRVGNAAGNKATYIPKSGLLQGVVTEITVAQTFVANSKGGLDAVITYDGGKTATVNYIPDSGFTRNVPDMELMKIGEYKNVESVAVVTRGTGEQFLPPVIFTVINENPDQAAPERVTKKYVRPFIPTVTPAAVKPLIVPNAQSSLSINEICSNNTLGFKDKNDLFSDWIELYNNSTSDLDISGYGITDDKDLQFKWIFPAGTIVPANGYLIVVASGEDTVIEGELHTNFSISAGGEKIMLSNSEGGIIDVVATPALDENTTLSRIPDGGTVLKVTKPTVSASNSDVEAIKTYMTKPVFSAESGFYTSQFNLTLTSPTNGSIYYTTDGSIPTLSSNMYSAPVSVVNRTSQPNGISKLTYPTSTYVPTVNVDKSMIVRAAVIDSEGNSSEVVTKSYFVGFNMANDFNNMMVISMSTDAANLFDSGYGIFPNYAEQRSEFEREVHIDMFEKDGSLVIDQNAGVRVRAYGYKGMPQKGLNFYARGDYGAKKFDYPLFDKAVSHIDGSRVESYDTFALRHGSYNYDGLRYMDGAAQYLGSELGTGFQSQRPVVLFINGEYWGIYYMSERVSNGYIKSHYGVPEEDQILIKNHLNKGDAVEADRQLYDAERNWLKDTNFSIPANYDLLAKKYDIENLMMYWASNVNTTNRDWLGYNFATWRTRDITNEPFHDGRWRFLMYDLDTAYISAGDDQIPNQMKNSYALAIMSNPSLKRVFLNILLDSYNNTFAPQRAYNELEYWFNEMMPTFLPDMKNRWGSFSDIGGALGGKYTSVVIREKYELKYIKQVFGLTGEYVGLNVRVNDSEYGTVKINSMNHDFTKGSYSTRNFTDYTSSLIATPFEGYKFVGWTKTEGTSLSSETDETTYVTLSPNGTMVQANFAPIVDIKGTGTESDPYQIATAEDLSWMSSKIINSNATFGNKYYILTNNIVFTGENNFIAIGNKDNTFKGYFDGKYHTVNGINISSTTQGQGLFGYVGIGGKVENTGVTNINVVTTGTDGKNIGGIVGNNAGTIENCFSTGSLSGASTVGGITGNNSAGTVKNCYSIVTVTSASTTTRGGVAGKTELLGEVNNSYSIIIPVGKNDGGTVDNLTSAKTADEFSNGTVTRLLNGATTVWVNGGASPIFANGTANADIILNCTNEIVKVDSKIALNNVKLVLASYDGNTLKDIKIIDFTAIANSSNEVQIPNDFETVTDGKIKVMLWNDIGNIMPISYYLSVNN